MEPVVVPPPDIDGLLREAVFSSSRSGGPGGQNVNKVNSKVSLRFDIPNSFSLSDEQKELILKRTRTKVTVDGILTLSSQASRSQHDNKNDVIEKFRQIIARAFEEKKPRKRTKPSATAKQKRLTGKKITSDKKQMRKKPVV